jgi:branched-chain amino acid transport system ATP-binding protein
MAQVQGKIRDKSPDERPVLKITDLYKRYGGFEVLANVHLEIREGDLHALIGSNGAGKTTLFDTICGFIKPSRGSIRFLDREITSLPAHKRAPLGIGRTFQITTLFRSISVLENLRLTLESLPGTRLPFLKSAGFSEKNLAPMKDLLHTWGLWDTRNTPVAALPYGVQRQLEIIMALLQKPKLLMLDEPMAGLEAGNRMSMMRLIRESSKKTTILFIEHDMSVALQLATHVTVLHQGKIVVQGSPEQVQNNKEVQRIYFGYEE